MVVIEEESQNNQVNNRTAPEVSIDATEEATGREAEGFETASEGEGDGETEEQPAPPKDDSYKDALTDEQLQQRALSQANDVKAEGNQLFGSGQYEDALSKYELALQLAAEIPSAIELRSMCHANRAVCFSKMGKYDETIKECTKALELNPSYMKALLRRAEGHEKLEHFEEAIADMKKILELDPSNDQARRAIRRLEPLAAEKREKMKEEMIGKLKEMGNSVLGRFGMSVDDFKAVKDPNTGSYSISFQK
ncbi:tetratricopeptide repeat protein 1-like [Macadamia integrifolia]|uniref:tetratricopeptide repeat protein 1-like n=1 Tax=Macadamia integrifolia TaxID=60698 RepID=UPI001C4E4281|nr:tetratricopeptide repeat protein 1-like [Macadamia integrifolia]XP_042515730.1 tetratricopeptide repeat protein 1-like [Macadamia integrifolia]